jgi:hypothetical protein
MDAPDTSDRPSEETVLERTGKTWDEWFALLDEWRANGALAPRHRTPPARDSLRTAQPNRSARFDAGDGATRVVVGFESRGPEKSTVAVEHERLADAAVAERTKTEWRERLARLREALEA